jgi:hypothetical protein
MKAMTAAERALVDARLDALAAEIRELARDIAALTAASVPRLPLAVA